MNFYKTKSRNISNLAKILVKDYNGKLLHDFEKLIELPGVGRKTANVFLSEHGFEGLAVDTHVYFISRRLGWSKNKNPHKVEMDLKKLFPLDYWSEVNPILVRFGKKHTSRKKKNELLDEINNIQ